MKQQAERPNAFFFPVSLAGDALAAQTHADKERIGHRVVDRHEWVKLTHREPLLVRIIEVYGKRPNEGQIAATVKFSSRPKAYYVQY